ncbi:hypothetical protein Lal_00021997 [Lupinus albus]|uniref:RNA helicase n=1 Tax=Lupinus albus TaxID=3870 RepID=A0A6A4NM81_LUPAL|nr:putative RNA helicase transcription factor C2H2 family [Lupinus albus]KAF1864341.1 hypothetical protein Lal_00021997 [Lupinus albus]
MNTFNQPSSGVTTRHHNFNSHHQPPQQPPPSHGAQTSHPPHHSLHHWNPGVNPPDKTSTTLRRPNFVITLRTGRRSFRRDEIMALISECDSKPEFKKFPVGDRIAGKIGFRQWCDALDAVVWFWKTRLNEIHDLMPELTSYVKVPSDMYELERRLKALFSYHVKCLMNEGKEVKRLNVEIEQLSKEIDSICKVLSKPLPIPVYNQRVEKKKGLIAEKKLVDKRIREFKNAMECLVKKFEEEEEEEEEGENNKVLKDEESVVSVFKIEGKLDWKKVHCMIMRERKRLEQGLPIYAYRSDIIHQVHSHQVTVLIGETGSGKSTQLVQFLADSGISANESIVCTQPRKIASKSVSERVQEESSGCYGDNTIKSYSTFSSSHRFDSRITFMTDNCLLQHYMDDENLFGVSCIIIDEAHERSLNTDILLALIKSLLSRRVDMRLIIMSATADAEQLSNYFYGCGILHVLGRNFPVDVRYVPSDNTEHSGSAVIASYVSDVVRIATEIHKTEKEGSILAFLTSQVEVEWACDKFRDTSAVALPLHGKLSSEEQFHVFQNYSGKRKVIFATNLAETSLTIPGVKYVIDSGFVKDCRFDPSSGMSVLKVCRISQSSALQRAGRAGRTEPGRCYRLYSEADFQSMEPTQEPEIRRVQLGVAVLRILALGVKNVQEFDFVDAPSSRSIEMAIKNLIQLGVIRLNKNLHELTHEGRYLVRMGVEPRLGKLILGCSRYGMGREGVVLAALMANASTIFCRVGKEDDKQRSDCHKVQFCHCDGDLFTLLSVYKEWEALPRDRKNKWCWENSINAKSMRRCQDTVVELESCLERELCLVTPQYWQWNPSKPSDYDEHLKKIILASLAENVAMYSGCDQLGYEVAQTGQLVQLHPSCSLRVYAQKPSWVVFGELLSVSNQYLACVTAFDFDSLYNLSPPPPFDVSKMEKKKLQMRRLTGLGSILLKRLCGKGNSSVLGLVSRIRKACRDDRIVVEVNVGQNDIQLYATSHDMETALGLLNDVLEYEKKLLYTECVEKCLYHGFSPSVALFGSGAEIKHLELEKRFLCIDVSHPNINAIDDTQLLMFFENTSGDICSVQKFTYMAKDAEEREKWVKITFLSPDAAEKAADLDGVEFCGFPLKVVPSRIAVGGDKTLSFPAVKAKISWLRRPSKGFGILKCDVNDVNFILGDFYNLAIGGRYVRCDASTKSADCITIGGIDKELSESEILDELKAATSRRILDFFLLRGDAILNPPCSVFEEALLKEISPFMPNINPHISSCRVQVFPSEPRDTFMKALITFDGRLHLEAAKALEQIEGKVLPVCFTWQKIKCERMFHSSLVLPVPVFSVIKEELEKVLSRFKNVKGLELIVDRFTNGSRRVRITANATKTVAEVRRQLEELSRGKTVEDDNLTPIVLQHMLTKDGFNVKNSLQEETGTYIFLDKHNLSIQVFGPPDKVAFAKQKLVQLLLSLHERKQLEVHLLGRDLPPDLMKQVVKNFGPDLHGLKEKVPGADPILDTRRQIICLRGNKELKPRVQEIIFETAHSCDSLVQRLHNGPTCPICLCEVEDGVRLEGCGHLFCQLCLVEQCESAIRNLGSFPICCAHEGCGHPFLIADLRSLLSHVKLDELFKASLGAFVASSGGTYRFCPSPDCPSIYRVADPDTPGEPFACGVCYSETCTSCHLEYHPYVSCENYREFKKDPDSSLKEWCKGKEHVKCCPVCGFTIEKVDGCNHIECKCGKHVCWSCLEYFESSDDCYNHLRNIHMTII